MNQKIKFLIAAALGAMVSVAAFAQHQVSGTVRDAAGEPVIGAGVVQQGTQNGAVTDLDGGWTLNVPEGANLVVSCVGYADQTITVVPGQSIYNVVLQDDAEFLEDLVVIGYQTVKRRDLTGAVASVNSKQLTAAPVSNVAQAIQGKLPGVNVVSQDGRPGATINIRVRGGSSISQSNEPLVLIDGVAGSISDIPSEQIESIDVLKDASSTAIYGARGANGVILITTKGAKEGKVRVTYNGYAKFNTPTKYLEGMGPYDYLSYVWANAAANGSDYLDPFEKLFGIGSYGDINRYKNIDMYDVQRKVYGNSFSHNHDIAISGGTDATKVLFGVNYNDEDGMKVNSYAKRANVTLKVNQKIRENLGLNLDLRYTDWTSLGYEGTGSRSGSILSSAYRFRPIATSDLLGNVSALREGAVEQYGKEALWDSYDPYNRVMDYEPLVNSQRVRANTGINWQIIKGLTYHSEISLGRYYQQNKTWTGPTTSGYLDDTTGEALYAGKATLYQGNSWSMRWTNTLNYLFTLGNIHDFNFLLGQEVSNSGGDSMTISTDYFPVNFTKENAFAMINQFDQSKSSMTTSQLFKSGYNTPNRILSYFARMNYTLLDRYLFTLTFRADGSSKFAPSNRWGYFPAAAFAWRVSEEPFMKNVSWLDDLKFRLSYGTVGNDGISADLWSQTWESASKNPAAINGTSYAYYDLASSMANSDLKWETTITRDAGIDFALMKGRLTGTVDVYWNTTKDLLMNVTIPGITGFTSTYANIGQTSNKGLEFSLNANLIQTRDWGLTVGGNINFNRNNIDALAANISTYYGSSWFHSGNPGNDYCFFVGQPVGLVRGLQYVGWYTTADFDYDPATQVYTLKAGVPDVASNLTGVFHGVTNNVPAGQNAYPGMAKYKDVDGSGTVDENDYEVIGNMNPKFTGGFNITANYKNWDMSAYFNYSVGNQIYNINKLVTLNGYKETGVYENHLDLLKDSYRIYDIQNGQLVRVHDPAALDALNANAKYPLFYNENGVVSDLGIEDGSYLRLNTLSVGYTLPAESAVARALTISNLRIYASVYNLFTLTKYSGLDPEVSTNNNMNATYPTPGIDYGAYPRARSFVLGVNLTF